MSTSLEVLFSPAEFAALKDRDLSGTWCVVFDVLRATSSMVTALVHGAQKIVPVLDIPEALRLREREPGAILAGERQGVRIGAALTGSVDFDLGNSPREFLAGVQGKTIIMTTTNGTRALRSCAHAQKILVGAFLNLSVTVEHILNSRAPAVLVICSGTHEEAAYEDTLAAGAACERLWAVYGQARAADSAIMARDLFRRAAPRLLEAFSESRNGRRLLSLPELAEDVAFCAQADCFPALVEMDRAGQVTRRL